MFIKVLLTCKLVIKATQRKCKRLKRRERPLEIHIEAMFRNSSEL